MCEVCLSMCVSVYKLCPSVSLRVPIYLPICFSVLCVFQQQTSFTGVMPLSSFTVNGLQYYKGRCSFSGQSMPTTDGVHVYNLRVDPGENWNGNNLFAGPRLAIR